MYEYWKNAQFIRFGIIHGFKYPRGVWNPNTSEKGGTTLLSSPKHSDRVWNPRNLHSVGGACSFPGVNRFEREAKTHHPIPMLEMSEAKFLLPDLTAWRAHSSRYWFNGTVKDTITESRKFSNPLWDTFYKHPRNNPKFQPPKWWRKASFTLKAQQILRATYTNLVAPVTWRPALCTPVVINLRFHKKWGLSWLCQNDLHDGVY